MDNTAPRFTYELTFTNYQGKPVTFTGTKRNGTASLLKVLREKGDPAASARAILVGPPGGRLRRLGWAWAGMTRADATYLVGEQTARKGYQAPSGFYIAVSTDSNEGIEP